MLSLTTAAARAPFIPSKRAANRAILRDFVGREEELSTLLHMLLDGGPRVGFVYGIPGSGKSALLKVFAQSARVAGATVVCLDCGSIEPTEAGVLAELATASGGVPGTPQDIALRFGRIGTRVALILDSYERFGLMDSWLRQVFVPLLPDHVRLVIGGREEPAAAWPALRMPLADLDSRSSSDYLVRAGIPASEAGNMHRTLGSLPLTLTLTALLQGVERPEALGSGAGSRVVADLTRLYLSDVADCQTRLALEAASVARRVTLPLLSALLTDTSPQDALERIRMLPFVHRDKDGLYIHDAVRDAIARSLRIEDPQRYRSYRRLAYRHFVANLRTSTTSGHWNSIADLLHLLENPLLREAFIPTGPREYSVESLPHSVFEAEPSECPGTPDAFRAVSDRNGHVVGVHCVLDSSRGPDSALRDPVLRVWMDHLKKHPMPRQQKALFVRRWPSAEFGAIASAVERACWLDLVRKYLELGPHLRRVYVTIQDSSSCAALAQKLGFQVLSACGPADGDGNSSTLMLDLGASSVDGWLAKLVAAELGVEDDGLLDSVSRELLLDGRRISLTPLEFAVMEYLQQRAGQAVTRVSLLENVWERSEIGGSNVVDVVIRALRRKLGDRASAIETVQGVGYRLREV